MVHFSDTKVLGLQKITSYNFNLDEVVLSLGEEDQPVSTSHDIFVLWADDSSKAFYFIYSSIQLFCLLYNNVPFVSESIETTIFLKIIRNCYLLRFGYIVSIFSHINLSKCIHI